MSTAILTAVIGPTGPSLIDVSAVVATKTRTLPLQQALDSLASQSVQPAEIIIVDASEDSNTRELCEKGIAKLRSQLRWTKAKEQGAASQRNEGVAIATQPVIWFFDDDIRFEQDCVSRMWRALEAESQLGGVNAMIVNQSYQSPGVPSRLMFALMNGRKEKSFAGKVIGPAINLLPEDRDDLPEVVPVEWLNTTCTMYRREALPNPPFPAQFTGYSLMEDLALSLEVGKKWKLANARTARIFHDSQPGDYKSDQRTLSCMELTNRYYVMTQIMGKSGLADQARLGAWELFSLGSVVAHKANRRQIPDILAGKWCGLRQILSGKDRA